ncbi:hypothetical protein F511_43530 [Dorcoceras hygrometricum]|uniref:Uncharacterized protein n=1 Tax=Dorcoceras hygrometricum TaxID=472368 RepID=A0A2Z7D3C9_9LAMI|nr:hypothetical protein F511_43530 [Dorcoceras hygrometricum]
MMHRRFNQLLQAFISCKQSAIATKVRFTSKIQAKDGIRQLRREEEKKKLKADVDLTRRKAEADISRTQRSEEVD